MRTPDPGDAARIELLLAELRLPAIKLVWASLAVQADKEGWPAGRFLAALAEHEITERSRRRLERHLAEARLPPGKTLDAFDFEGVPVVSKAQVMAVAAGDAWLNNGANLLLFGPPGGGKSHVAAALGFALVDNGCAFCSPVPLTSSSGCKSPAASSLSKLPLPSSTNSTS
jgi:DNA replication protein DnaC